MSKSVVRELDVVVLSGLALVGLVATTRNSTPTAERDVTPGHHRVSDGGHEHAFAERGGYADSPTEIPARGWWAIVKRVPRQVSDNRLMAEAAGVTFYGLLAIFPALAALVSLYGLVADPATISAHLSDFAGMVPGGGMEILNDQLKQLASHSGGTLSLGAVVGLLAALWSANGGTKALFDALNVVYGEREKRGFILRTAISLAVTLGTLVFVLLALAAVIAIPVILQFIGLGMASDLLLRILRWPLLLVGLTVLLAFIYRFGPSREQARWRWVSWGGAFAAVVWVLGSIAFSWYVANFGTYNKTYGSLGAIVGFMTWLWLSSLVVLVGAQLNAEMEHQTIRDSTTGPEKPLGTRGATKADEVAAAAE